MAFDSAANILNDAAVELGLISTDVADPYLSTDANIIQLCRFLKGVGQDLARDHQWTHLQREVTFSTVNGVAEYDLPDDFARMVDQTQWNRSGVMPLFGPLSSQGWQLLKAYSALGESELWFRTVGGKLTLHPTPASAQALAYEYISSWWVQNGDVTPTADSPTGGMDTLWFDRRLLVCGVKLAFQRAKGFDTTAAQADFDEALARARGGDGAAPVLSLNARGVLAQRLVGPGNLPDTGYGS